MRDRILRNALFGQPGEYLGWQPALDVYEIRDGWLVKADLAGVRPAEVTVSLAGRMLRIQGVRHDWCVEEGCCQYRMEIAYSRFERAVELPVDPGDATVQTEYRDGMLLVRIRRGKTS